MVPKVERLFGIRLDLNYYPFPAPWPDGVASLFTGSALPMRFADRRGRPIDVFQLATVVTDESGQRAGVAIGELLDRALGTSGWPAVLCVNAHTDVGPGERVSDEVVAASLDRGVPLVAANSMLEWIDAREACLVRNIHWGGGALSFELRVDPRAGGRLRLILPARVGLDRTLVSVERGGRRVDASTIDLEGLEYAMFDGVSGTYTARFVPSPVVVHAGMPRTAS
jgi:hypothetical protein